MRYALARAGAVLVPINFMLNAEEIAYILRHSGAKVLCTDSGMAPQAMAAAKLDTSVEQFVWLPSMRPTEPVDGMITLQSLLERGAGAPDPRSSCRTMRWRRFSTPAARNRCRRARC